MELKLGRPATQPCSVIKHFITIALFLPPLLFAEPTRHLFLDPAFIESSENVEFGVNSPERREIVIRSDRPWEKLLISFYLTVLDDGGKLRMWYICRDAENRPNVAYAESNDGVNWEKPNLGIVENEGSTNNNLVGMDSLEGTVYIDPHAPPEERYCYVTHLITEGMVRFHSPDGLRWNRDEKPLVNFGADSQANTFWDERTNTYALYLRAWERRVDDKLYRTQVRADLESLTKPLAIQPSEKNLYIWGKEKTAIIDDEFPQVLATDEKDPPDSDVYTISAQPYPLDPTWYVGFPSFFQREAHRSDGRLDVAFIGSRDGFEWHRYDRKPYARTGVAGSESANMVYIGPGLICRGDEIWQYGTGFHSRHGDIEARKRKTDGVIHRYVQRVDGFVSANFANDGGRLETSPVEVVGDRLLVNVETSALGSIRVGLQDLEGNAIEGFALEDCDLLRTNATGAVVSWNDSSDLSSLEGRKARAVFEGSAAKLFSFRFEKISPEP